MSVTNFTAIHPIVVKIQNEETDIAMPRATLTAWLKIDCEESR